MNSTDKWIQDAKGWWYRYADGSYPKNQWVKLAGEWYYFDSYGYAIQNQWKCLKGLWYYFNDKCKMVRGFPQPQSRIKTGGGNADWIRSGWYRVVLLPALQ